MEESVRWSLKVSRKTDEALRAYLGHVGGRKGALSRFIEQAVQAKLAASVSRRGKGADVDRSGPLPEFADTLSAIRARTRSLSRVRFEKLVAEARAHARKRR